MDDTTYTVTAYSRIESSNGDEKFIKMAETTTQSHSIALTDELAYYYQENKDDSFRSPIELVVQVSVITDGKTSAEGWSGSVGLIDFFPPEETPEIGTDIPLEDITAMNWHSNGTYMEANYHFSIWFEEDKTLLSASYFTPEDHIEFDDKEMSEEYRQEVLDILSRGELFREYVMDPEIHELDGGDEYIKIEWKDMKSAEKRYYRLKLDAADKELVEELVTMPAE